MPPELSDVAANIHDFAVDPSRHPKLDEIRCQSRYPRSQAGRHEDADMRMASYVKMDSTMLGCWNTAAMTDCLDSAFAFGCGIVYTAATKCRGSHNVASSEADALQAARLFGENVFQLTTAGHLTYLSPAPHELTRNISALVESLL